MKTRDKKTDQQRRKFMRDSVATGASVVLAAGAPAIVVAASVDGETPSAKQKAGYQLSQHVLDYYKTCMR